MKTYLTSLFCVVRCILFPETKIVVSSKTLKQANEVLLKIQDDFMKQSAILRSEISKCSIGQNDASIYFKNNSWIKTRTANDNARSARANIIIIDEFRMVDEMVINTVLRKFLTSPRQPNYLNKEEYSHLQERNKEIYMSSAWFKSHWSWKKAISYTKNFFNPSKKYFICGLPYQISIKEGLLQRSQIEDEMSEADFNEFVHLMEMECLWFGDTDGSLFKYEELNKIRRKTDAFLPLEFYSEDNPVPDRLPTENRILSVDVALMASSKKKQNDAAALYINSSIQKNDTSTQSNIRYGDTFEGLPTDELGIIIMRWFYKYKCNYLVLDTNGNGLSVYDFLIKDRYDPETGETYKALTCINDDDMASRCKVKDAEKAIYSFKGNRKLNSEMCVLLRNGILNGKLNLLVSEMECDEALKKAVKGYSKLTPTQVSKLKMPFMQTTMAIYELIKLEHDIKDGNITVREVSGMRKDRYSSIGMNFWCANQLELQLKPKRNENNDYSKLFAVRSRKRVTRYT